MNDTSNNANQSKDLQFKNLKIGDIVTFGNYYNRSDSLKQPIKWCVISVDDQHEKALLLSLEILETMFFNDKLEEKSKTRFNLSSPKTYWHESRIREWLNHDFIDEAFTKEEQSQIALSAIVSVHHRKNRHSRREPTRASFPNENKVLFCGAEDGFGRVTKLPIMYSDFNSLEQYETVDKVFLLSSAEVNFLLKDLPFKKAKPTYRVLKSGVQVDKEGYCRWTLRSRTYDSLDMVNIINKVAIIKSLLKVLIITVIYALFVACMLLYKIPLDVFPITFVLFLAAIIFSLASGFSGDFNRVKSNIRPAMFVKFESLYKKPTQEKSI